MLSPDDLRIDALAGAIGALADRERGPADLIRLLCAGDRLLDQIASASDDDLVEAVDWCDADEVAQALGYVAGLALQMRQALRHYYGASLDKLES
jgi:hypothetical protein